MSTVLRLSNFLLTINLFISSCSQKSTKVDLLDEPDAEHIVTVNFDNKSEIKYEDYIEFVKYVKLETTDESLIGAVDKLLFDDDMIFVIDKQVTKSIFVFDDKGKFMHKIHAVGDGPDKYFSILDVSLDVTNKLICLVDLDGRRIKFYTYEGDFIENLRMPFLFSSMIHLTDDQFVFNSGLSANQDKEEIDGYSLVVADMEGKVSYKAFEDRNHNFSFSIHDPLQNSGSDIFYNPRYSNVIYSISQEGASPFYKIDMGIHAFPQERLPSINTQEYLEMDANKSFVNGYISLKDGAMFIIFGDKQVFNVLYSKESGNSISLLRPVFNHFSHSLFSSNGSASYFHYFDQSIVTVSWPDVVLMLGEISPKSGREESGLDQLLEGIDKSSNPVLSFFNLKSF
ncbi:6-bladed beta-propeller [Belliella sp. DSM 111904]|uniref:6-bladed beta-propeller n=1 Tax=Belliella filtrata TaxID=2923435 RepID=A0ABS9V2B6_9BACT|nr:6-bladed beta-propeller [Belliella filtrata]MCH7410553.1 6-bladed beta-propeller [Belliella filtrata]